MRQYFKLSHPPRRQLDLSKWTRCLCQSTELDPNTHDTLLTVSSELDTDLTAVCRLQTPWYEIC